MSGKTIELSATKDENLGHKLRKAVELLFCSDIPIVSAAQVSNTEEYSLARILLRNPIDKPRAMRVLASAKIDVR